MAKPFRIKSGKWRVHWIDCDGFRRSKVLNTINDAKIFSKRKESEAYQIKNGLMARPIEVQTFDKLCDHWIKHKARNKRSGKHDVSIINTHLLPFFKNTRIDQIKPIHCDQLKIKLSDRAPKTIVNILTLLISMLNSAKDEGWLQNVPPIKKPKITLVEKDFRYLKTQEEIERFLRVARDTSHDAYDLYAFVIHSGLRAGEVADLKFSDIDFDKNLIHIKRSWGGPTKSGETRIIPLAPAIKPILLKRKAEAVSEHIFYNTFGNPLRPSDRIFQETLKKVLSRAGFPRLKIRTKDFHYVNFHGLRHTFASHWCMNGLDQFMLQKILGHQDAKMTARYSHLDPSVYADIQSKVHNFIPDFSNENVIQLTKGPVRDAGQIDGYKHKTPCKQIHVR